MINRTRPGPPILSFVKRACVCVESPFGSPDDEIIKRNVFYAQNCMMDSLQRGEAPFLGHLLYTQILRDREPLERQFGLESHLSWLLASDGVAFYIDHGMSPGMVEALATATQHGIPTLERRLYSDANVQTSEGGNLHPPAQSPWEVPGLVPFRRPQSGG